MNRLWLASLFLTTALAAPLSQNETNKETAKINFAYAVDITAATSSSTFRCYGDQGFRTAFIKIYQPINNGMPNPNGPANVLNALNAGLGAEVFISPQPTSSKQGFEQMDEAYNYVTAQGINIKSIWIQVTSPINWPSNQQNNANFIYSLLARAQQRNLKIGIYTNAYDWEQITGGWTGWMNVAGGVNLWYWHVTAQGSAGQTQSNFDDFTPFSGFNNPLVKQYGQNINMCSTTVNVNAYVYSNKAASEVQKTTAKEVEKVVAAPDDKPVAGLLMYSQSN